MTCGRVPGLRIFTATSVPSISVALYTCPMEAAATGSGVITLNTSATGRPRSSSMILNASADGNGGTRSCSLVSSSITSSSTRSGRFARFWPSLTNRGPSDVSVFLSSVA